MTRLTPLILCLATVACGGTSPTSPSNLTQALVVSNNSWRMSYNGINRAGDNTAGDVIDLGEGQQCAAARLSLGRWPPLPEGQSFLTLTVGRNSQTIRTDDRAITVCGTGPVGVTKNPARSAP